MKYLILVFLLYSGSILKAQKTEISESEKQAFVKIFLRSKTKTLNSDSIAIQTLTNSGISAKRYTEFITSGFDGQRQALTEEDSSTLQVFTDVKNILAARKQWQLSSICDQEKMSIERYLSLLSTYRNEISFQQSLLQIFTAEISQK